MPLAELTGFLGQNTKVEAVFLPDGLGVSSINQKPSEQADLRPWAVPLAVNANVPAGRKTLYRMGRDTASTTSFWLSWTTEVHVIRGFDSTDSTERTYFTGSGVPRFTDNILALAAAPYPTASRELAVPQPTIAPTVTLSVDGSSGDTRRLYYVYTRVNDLGWESAPSPPTLAQTAKPGATFTLSFVESVPAGNYAITKVRWYRTQVFPEATSAEFFFIGEYAVNASPMYDSGVIITGDRLPTEDWLAPPEDGHSLTDCWNQFATMLSGKTVRGCEPGYLYAWPPAYEYILTSTPIAQAAFAQRLVVFTTAGAEVFTGADPGSLDQKPLRLAPMVSTRSLVVGETWCAWAASDGLWYYGTDGQRCLTASCLTRAQWEAMVPSTVQGYLLQLEQRSLYVGFHTVGGNLKGFVIDPANPLGIYMLSTGYAAGYWDPLLRKLFVLDGGTLKIFDGGATNMTVTFRGKLVRALAEAEAEWLELLADGTVAAKLLVDGTSVYEHSVVTGEHRLHDGTSGRNWQLEVSATAPVVGVTVE
jgi:hypothetical protein